MPELPISSSQPQEIKPRGGRRENSGRKALPEKERKVPLTIYLTPAERDFVRANGGTSFIRLSIFGRR